MADPSPFSDAGESAPNTPRWVKVFGIIAIVVFLLFVVQLLAGGGRHGPGRHRLSDGAPDGQTPPTDVTEGGRAITEAGR